MKVYIVMYSWSLCDFEECEVYKVCASRAAAEHEAAVLTEKNNSVYQCWHVEEHEVEV